MSLLHRLVIRLSTFFPAMAEAVSCRPRPIAAGGPISVLSTLRSPDGSNLLAAGVCQSADNCNLQLFAADGSLRSSLALPASASVVEAVSLNGHSAISRPRGHRGGQGTACRWTGTPRRNRQLRDTPCLRRRCAQLWLFSFRPPALYATRSAGLRGHAACSGATRS